MMSPGHILMLWAFGNLLFVLVTCAVMEAK